MVAYAPRAHRSASPGGSGPAAVDWRPSAGQEQSALIGAIAIGVVLFAAAVFAVRAGGGWVALGWVLMVIVILGAIGAVGSRFTRK